MIGNYGKYKCTENCRQGVHLEGAEGLASCDGDDGVLGCQVRAHFFQHRRHKLWLDSHKNDLALLYHLRRMDGYLFLARNAAVSDSFLHVGGCSPRSASPHQTIYGCKQSLFAHLHVAIDSFDVEALEHLFPGCHRICGYNVICIKNSLGYETSSQSLGHLSSSNEAYSPSELFQCHPCGLCNPLNCDLLLSITYSGERKGTRDNLGVSVSPLSPESSEENAMSRVTAQSACKL